VRVGDNCEIGADTTIHPNVTVYANTQIGARVLIHAGAVIGADGFGFFPDRGRLRKWPHVGNVVIEDDVEIGANACIDRAKFGTTLIERGVKIDNLVQVAHNCRVGRGSILAGQTGLSGSVVLEDGVTCAGQVGIGDHVTIGAGATLAAQTGAIGDVPAGEVHFGTPSKPHRRALQEAALLGFLASNARAVRRLVRGAGES
ncbi:MAG TPA: UDP-3-O-(3-hydroxymyristoyl)glucosamine N-acyltransferase, partial [Phycisphaerae bacterium]|nr:UDP-3-O-(3-hydroxymyristoyl)glucosamine N-acyltransferase [Phycisphaerae bacterium]